MQRARLAPVVLGEREAAAHDDDARPVRRAGPTRGRSAAIATTNGTAAITGVARRRVRSTPPRRRGSPSRRRRRVVTSRSAAPAAPGGRHVPQRPREERRDARRMGVGAAGHEARGHRVRRGGHEEPLAVRVGDRDARIHVVHDVVVERDAERGEHLVEPRGAATRAPSVASDGPIAARSVPPCRSQRAQPVGLVGARTARADPRGRRRRSPRRGRARRRAVGVDARQLVVVLLEQIAHAPERVALVLLRRRARARRGPP